MGAWDDRQEVKYLAMDLDDALDVIARVRDLAVTNLSISPHVERLILEIVGPPIDA